MAKDLDLSFFNTEDVFNKSEYDLNNNDIIDIAEKLHTEDPVEGTFYGMVDDVLGFHKIPNFHSNFNIDNPLENEILVFNNGVWENQTIIYDYEGLDDTPTLSDFAISGEYSDLIYRPFIPSNLEDFEDVQISVISGDSILMYDGSLEKWVSKDISSVVPDELNVIVRESKSGMPWKLQHSLNGGLGVLNVSQEAVSEIVNPRTINGQNALVTNSKAYLIGGNSMTGFIGNVYVSDIDSSGELIGFIDSDNDIPVGGIFSSIVYRNQVYILGGGYDGSQNLIPLFYKANIHVDGSLEAWEALPTPNTGGSLSSTITLIGDKLYVYGGLEEDYSYNNKLQYITLTDNGVGDNTWVVSREFTTFEKIENATLIYNDEGVFLYGLPDVVLHSTVDNFNNVDEAWSLTILEETFDDESVLFTTEDKLYAISSNDVKTYNLVDGKHVLISTQSFSTPLENIADIIVTNSMLYIFSEATIDIIEIPYIGGLDDYSEYYASPSVSYVKEVPEEDIEYVRKHKEWVRANKLSKFISEQVITTDNINTNDIPSKAYKLLKLTYEGEVFYLPSYKIKERDIPFLCVEKPSAFFSPWGYKGSPMTVGNNRNIKPSTNKEEIPVGYVNYHNYDFRASIYLEYPTIGETRSIVLDVESLFFFEVELYEGATTDTYGQPYTDRKFMYEYGTLYKLLGHRNTVDHSIFLNSTTRIHSGNTKNDIAYFELKISYKGVDTYDYTVNAYDTDYKLIYSYTLEDEELLNPTEFFTLRLNLLPDYSYVGGGFILDGSEEVSLIRFENQDCCELKPLVVETELLLERTDRDTVRNIGLSSFNGWVEFEGEWWYVVTNFTELRSIIGENKIVLVENAITDEQEFLLERDGITRPITLNRVITTNVKTLNGLFSSLGTYVDSYEIGKYYFHFNQNISQWDVSNVTSMGNTFQYMQGFNQDIGNWDVSNVSNMTYTFMGATSFNQDLSRWLVPKIPTKPFYFLLYNSALTNPNYLPLFGHSDYPEPSTPVIIPPEINTNFIVSGQYQKDALDYNIDNDGKTLKPLHIGGTHYGYTTPMALDYGYILNTPEIGETRSIYFNIGKDIGSHNVEYLQSLTFVLQNTKTTDYYDKDKISNKIGELFRTDIIRQEDTPEYDIVNIFKQYLGGIGYYQRNEQYVLTDMVETIEFTVTNINDKRVNIAIKYYNESGIEIASNNDMGIDVPFIGGKGLTLYITSNMFEESEAIGKDISVTLVEPVFNTNDIFEPYVEPEFPPQISLERKLNGVVVNNTYTYGWVEFEGEWFYVVKDSNELNSIISYFSSLHGMETQSNKSLPFMLRRDGVVHETTIQNIVTTNVTVMGNLGYQSNITLNFNQDLNTWDTSSITSFNEPFGYMINFNASLDNWDFSSTTSINRILIGATSFNQPLNTWDVSHITYMEGVFSHAESFNQDISGWNVSEVVNMQDMFHNAANFNQPLNTWDVSKVTNTTEMFRGATNFNQDISGWSFDAIEQMSGMFRDATNFNQDLSTWFIPRIYEKPSNFDTNTSAWVKINRQPTWGNSLVEVVNGTVRVKSGITYTGFVKYNNGSLAYIIEDNVEFRHLLDTAIIDPTYTYSRAVYPDGKTYIYFMNLITTNVTDMSSAFEDDDLMDVDITYWDVRNVTNMDKMFKNAIAFNRDLSKWQALQIPSKPFEFDENTPAWNKSGRQPNWLG